MGNDGSQEPSLPATTLLSFTNLQHKQPMLLMIYFHRFALKTRSSIFHFAFLASALRMGSPSTSAPISAASMWPLRSAPGRIHMETNIPCPCVYQQHMAYRCTPSSKVTFSVLFPRVSKSTKSGIELFKGLRSQF